MQVRILSNINSGQYVAGDVVDFPDAQAHELIEAGAAEALDQTAPQAAPETASVPDGFPVHEPTPEAPAAPEAPAVEAPLAPGSETPSAPTSPASSSTSDAKPPTPEQIAQDVAGL